MNHGEIFIVRDLAAFDGAIIAASSSGNTAWQLACRVNRRRAGESEDDYDQRIDGAVEAVPVLVCADEVI